MALPMKPSSHKSINSIGTKKSSTKRFILVSAIRREFALFTQVIKLESLCWMTVMFVLGNIRGNLNLRE